jgi:hypothetical protein
VEGGNQRTARGNGRKAAIAVDIRKGEKAGIYVCIPASSESLRYNTSVSVYAEFCPSKSSSFVDKNTLTKYILIKISVTNKPIAILTGRKTTGTEQFRRMQRRSPAFAS